MLRYNFQYGRESVLPVAHIFIYLQTNIMTMAFANHVTQLVIHATDQPKKLAFHVPLHYYYRVPNVLENVMLDIIVMAECVLLVCTLVVGVAQEQIAQNVKMVYK